VEVTNLAKADVHSGSAASMGATIGGSLDLKRKKGAFGTEAFRPTVFAGYETNNRQKIAGTALTYSNPRFFANADFTYRAADNYKAGNGTEIPYSQFTKYNMSVIAGYKLSERQHVEASVIYDHAVDVGYPALPM